MKILLAIIVMIIATQITRFLPFIIFKKKEPSETLKTVSKFIPGAVMITLVLISIPINMDISSNYKIWLGSIIVIVLHLTFNKPLISILGGTGLYCLINYIL